MHDESPSVDDRTERGRSVGELAALSGVTVRTLHHYDRIGLLSPDRRGNSGYRYYGARELRKLQQILLYRELDIPLEAIGKLLDSPGFDAAEALENHKRTLEARKDRLDSLIRTVERSIARERGEIMVSDKDMYEGFSDERIAAMKKEAQARWGATEAYAQSAKRVSSMTKEDFAAVKARGEALEREFAILHHSGARADGEEAERTAAKWADHLRSFYEPTPEILSGLGRLYVDSPDFRARYEAIAAGLPEFIRDALLAYAARIART